MTLLSACAAERRSEHDQLPEYYHFPGPRRALHQPDPVVEDSTNGAVTGPRKTKTTPKPGLR